MIFSYTGNQLSNFLDTNNDKSFRKSENHSLHDFLNVNSGVPPLASA